MSGGPGNALFSLSNYSLTSSTRCRQKKAARFPGAALGARLFDFSAFNALADTILHSVQSTNKVHACCRALKLAAVRGCLFSGDFVLQEYICISPQPSPSLSAHPTPAQVHAPAVPVSESVVYSQDGHGGCPVPEEAHGEEHDVAVVLLIPHWTSPRPEQHDPDLGGTRNLLPQGKKNNQCIAGLQHPSVHLGYHHDPYGDQGT